MLGNPAIGDLLTSTALQGAKAVLDSNKAALDDSAKKTLVDPKSDAALRQYIQSFDTLINHELASQDMRVFWKTYLACVTVLNLEKEALEELLKVGITVYLGFNLFQEGFVGGFVHSFLEQIIDTGKFILNLGLFSSSIQRCSQGLFGLTVSDWLNWSEGSPIVDPSTVEQDCRPVLDLIESVKGLGQYMQSADAIIAAIGKTFIEDRVARMEAIEIALDIYIAALLNLGSNKEIYAELSKYSRDAKAMGEIAGVFYGMVFYEVITFIAPTAKIKHIDKLKYLAKALELLDDLGTIGSLLPDQVSPEGEPPPAPRLVPPAIPLASVMGASPSRKIIMSSKYERLFELLGDAFSEALAPARKKLIGKLDKGRLRLIAKAFERPEVKKAIRNIQWKLLIKQMEPVIHTALERAVGTTVRYGDKKLTETMNKFSNVLYYLKNHLDFGNNLKSFDEIVQMEKNMSQSMRTFDRAHIFDGQILDVDSRAAKELKKILGVKSKDDMMAVIIPTFDHNRSLRELFAMAGLQPEWIKKAVGGGYGSVTGKVKARIAFYPDPKLIPELTKQGKFVVTKATPFEDIFKEFTKIWEGTDIYNHPTQGKQLKKYLKEVGDKIKKAKADGLLDK